MNKAIFIFSKNIEYISKLVCMLKISSIHLSTSIQISFTTKHSAKMCSIVSRGCWQR